MTSPFARVPSDHQVLMASELLRNFTLPSAKSTLQPPGWKLVAFSKWPSSMPPPVLSVRHPDHAYVNELGGTIVWNIAGPPSKRMRNHQQYLTSTQADVVLQWDDVHLRRGLVIVHNVIAIQSTGPTTGPVILQNIRFPGRIPPINATKPITGASTTTAQLSAATTAQTRRATAAITPRVINAATNSGALKQNRFSAGGFGDIGLQWRDVKVHRAVSVVHNTLSVNVAATATGPITISNVTFNSGAFDHATPPRYFRLIVSPPPKISRLPRFRPIHGRVLHQNPRVLNQSVNSGILAGGQFASGGLGHVAFQWRKVGISGPVTIIDNVLSIKTSGPATSPVTIENVTFG